MYKKTLIYVGLAIFSLISLYVLSSDNRVQADHNPDHIVYKEVGLFKLNELTHELYNLSKTNNKIASYNQLQLMKLHIQSHQVELNRTFDNFNLFNQELKLLENQLVDTDNKQWKDTITKLFLATDAMVQGENGPWREYEVLMLERIRLMERSFIDSTAYRITTMQANLSTLQDQLSRITLAVQLVGNKARLDELQFRVLDMQAFMLALPAENEHTSYYKELEKSINGIKQTTLSLFGTTSSVIIEPVIVNNRIPIQIGLILATIIFTVLTIISYRKYKQAPYGVKQL